MKKKKHCVNSSYGRISIDIEPEGVAISQGDGRILVSPEEMEKLGKGLLAIKGKEFPPVTQSNSSPYMPYPPSFDPSLLQTQEPSSYMEKQKAMYKNAYSPWTPKEEELLRSLVSQKVPVEQMAQTMGRNVGAIYSRIAKLKLS